MTESIVNLTPRIEYVEASLEEVVRTFSHNLQADQPANISCLEIFIDHAKGVVLFKTLVTPILEETK